MDAALLVLFLGHLAAALEVPLDRKDRDACTTQHVHMQESLNGLMSEAETISLIID